MSQFNQPAAGVASAALTFMRSASEAKFLFEIQGANADVAVLNFKASEEISALFQVDLTLASETELTFAEVKLKEAVLTIKGHQEILDQPDRYFHGVIRKLRHSGSNGVHHFYRAQVVPYLWLLSVRTNCRIFQHTTIEEIVSTILKEHSIAGDRFEFRLEREKIPRKFCTQFEENDLHFISRLLEEEGIFYFFEHSEDKHVLVFCDTPAYYQEIRGNSAVTFNTNDGLAAENESVFAFYRSERVRSGKFTHRNYNFKTPTLDISTENEGEEETALEVYEYPGPYGETGRGDQLAKVRLQEIHSLKDKARGQSFCPRLVPGATFTLTDHSTNLLNDNYLLVEVIHTGRQPQVLGENASQSPTHYGNTFLAIPATATYRPERITSKPTIPGIQTARVTGPPGEEIYPDQYGRVKVQFPWDREGKGDEKTSCWLRVAQFWNSGFEGSQFIPRVGDEVLVAFVNGDMDYPIIIGSNVNENMRPNYDLPANKTQSGIRTRSYPNGSRDNYHELRFDDKKGSEEIYLQSEKDWNILVKNDKGQTVGRDESLTVGNNRSKTVGVNQSETIGVDKTIQVGANHNETIGANMTLSVGGFKNERVGINSLEMIGGAKELAIGGLYQVAVGGVMNETVAGAKTEEVGLAKAVFVGNNMIENVTGDRTTNTGGNYTETTSAKYYAKANEYVIEAPKITLKAGSSTIVMDGSSITIKASKVFTN
ncbi:type VI secretion system Vgr family protein [Geobacter sp.]|uniref:type VI secretion system Vgr family protein n=1 Tax=Geobacter sp. TaxID=46610 RepID=UPI0027B96F48|nr:type VI secretion system tip protein VgrG [Geobacter sp.]